jgi:phosphoribosyl 1,2-cyclic phosphodiesterase
MILIDWGHDWLSKAKLCNPDALFITHAHPDHAGGLARDVPCPVYATQESWHILSHYPVTVKKLIVPDKPITIGSLTITAITIEHSLHAPAVAYRISSKNTTIFYAPDIAQLPTPTTTLKNVDVYIGDGALTTRRMLLRTKDHHIIGHAPFEKQLSWCHAAQVPHCIITHCGTEIVTGNPAIITQKLNMLSNTYHIPITLAYDGMIFLPKI